MTDNPLLTLGGVMAGATFIGLTAMLAVIGTTKVLLDGVAHHVDAEDKRRFEQQRSGRAGRD